VCLFLTFVGCNETHSLVSTVRFVSEEKQVKLVLQYTSCDIRFSRYTSPSNGSLAHGYNTEFSSGHPSISRQTPFLRTAFSRTRPNMFTFTLCAPSGRNLSQLDPATVKGMQTTFDFHFVIQDMPTSTTAGRLSHNASGVAPSC
jgi:hypothetical protein